MSREPIGADAVVIAIAQLVSVTINMQIVKGKRTETKDFMNDWWSDKSVGGQWAKNEEIIKSFEQMAERMRNKQNGKV